MVTKPIPISKPLWRSLNLAKIHMVTKQFTSLFAFNFCLNLAKIHMVTKQLAEAIAMKIGLNLAKIHMVTKLRNN